MRGLRYYGDPCLRRVSRELDTQAEAEFVRELIRDMHRVLRTERGLGLAAPQVGESVRLFILNMAEMGIPGGGIFMNPVITTDGPEERDEEGCLSIPGVFERVNRPSRTRVEATDIKGDRFSLELTGYAGRAVQHEFDHLEGTLFVDRLSHLKRRLLRKRLAEITDEYVSGEDRIL